AMAVNTPVISTNLPGLNELLDNGGGHVVENSEAALRDAMQSFVAGELDIPPAPDLQPYRDEALASIYGKVLDVPAPAGVNTEWALRALDIDRMNNNRNKRIDGRLLWQCPLSGKFLGSI